VTFRLVQTLRPLNTLNLGGDGDEVELLEDVEKAFSILFDQKNVEELTTMGGLEILVADKRGTNAKSGQDWEQLCEIAQMHSGNAGRIDRNTTLFAKFAQPRELSNG
jgi:hypothetical protein